MLPPHTSQHRTGSMDYVLTRTGMPVCIMHTCDKPVATFDQLSLNFLPENDDSYPRMIIHEPVTSHRPTTTALGNTNQIPVVHLIHVTCPCQMVFQNRNVPNRPRN